MESIKFNSTANYQYVAVLGKEGVYTPENIEAKSLPSGFYKYSLLSNDLSTFGSVTFGDTAHADGSLITKESLGLRKDETRALGEEDWEVKDKPFDFESHFGKKLGIDAQIEQAEEKREKLVEAKRSKNRNKHRNHEDSEKDR